MVGRSYRWGRQRKFGRGFTLVELMVAIAIASLMLGAMPLAVMKVRHAVEYRATVRHVLSALGDARRAAVRSGEAHTFYVDLEKRSMGVDPGKSQSIPSGIEIRMVVAGQLIAPEGKAGIRFYPGGGATGGSVEVLDQPGHGTRVRVDWLLGRLSQEALL
mgnify:CR=1 FL=1